MEFTDFSRYALPVLAVLILGLCLTALLRRKPQSLGIVYLSDYFTGEEYPLTSRETSIGKHKNCDIRLNNETVLKQHAVIICGKDGWYIKPVGQAKVIVSTKTIDKVAELKAGDTISLGKAILVFNNRKQ